MIKFGTDGWRAIIARDFTFENIRYVALATARYVVKLANEKQAKRPTSKRPPIASCVLGYDTRFMSKEFAEEVAMVMASQGVIVHLADEIASTPQISFNAKQKNVNLGVVITASHNPAEYNGYKLKASFGGPATPEQISNVEKELAKIMVNPPKINLLPLQEYISKRQIKYFNAKESYVRMLKKKIDVEAIRESGIKIAVDLMHGANINTVSFLLPEVTEIHKEYNPSFGELHHPEPISENLFRLKEVVKDGKFDIGFAFDGDADRLGAVDHTGRFVDSHQIFMILLKYLVENKKKRAAVVKTVSLTSMVDKYCDSKKLELIETPVGFKYVAEQMIEKNVLIGGEESGGLATCLHIPERDGLFNAMLLLEVMVTKQKSLKQLCQELDEEFGPHRFMRRDKIVTPNKKETMLNYAKKGPTKIGKDEVIKINTKDGFKFFVNDGWVLIRASGTEPLIRFYAEASSFGKVSELIDEVEKWIK